MARGRRMRKSVAKNVQESSSSDDTSTGPDLPTELLEMIFSQLSLRDNIRVSCVCKRWLTVANSLRQPNETPWLMTFPKSGNWYQFYDPSSRRMYYAEYPELRGSRIFYARDGWLLAFKPKTRRVFFFHPYTRELIKLPKRQSALENLAFSAPPTSPTCVLFTMKNITPTLVSITTSQPGATGWTTLIFNSHVPFISSVWNKVVFHKGLFYCLSLNGVLGLFDPQRWVWTVTFVPPPKCTEHLSDEHWRRGKFMAESDGNVFIVYTCGTMLPFIYKLDQSARVWTEVGSSEGLTVFANSLSSMVRSGFHGSLRNSVCFSKVIFHGRRCVRYSLESARYYPQKRLFDWGSEDAFESVWIDRPADTSVVLEG